jgi:5-methyltetrahydrofolate--homocysteine methyltransferase
MTLDFDRRVRVIGERINPTGKKALKEALKARNWEYALQEAVRQLEAGAEILDVNAGMPGIDEQEAVLSILGLLEGAVQCPLQMDSADPAVLEAATRRTCGKVLLNSVNGKQSSMDAILPVAARYGANIVALMLDEDGIPTDAAKRMAIAERIINEAARYGIGPERIFVDCLVLTASAEQRQVRETLNAIRAIKARWPVHAVLGASNVSFGLPNRSILNRTFMAMALEAGLDAPITDPLAEGIMDTIRSYEVLAGNDTDSARYIAVYGGQEPVKSGGAAEVRTLEQCVSAGLREEAEKRTHELLEQHAPLAVVDGFLIPALEKVGRDFESGRIFLPQLLKSAEAVKGAFDLVREAIRKSGGAQVSKGKLALATVHGDIHDIGKNIVKVLLENYGYDVIDLGKDVPTEKVLEAIEQHDLKLVGLSALMTTTVVSMEKTIAAIRERYPECIIFVGGAVLTADYAAKIKAHYYCKDAQESVRVAGEIFGS